MNDTIAYVDESNSNQVMAVYQSGRPSNPVWPDRGYNEYPVSDGVANEISREYQATIQGDEIVGLTPNENPIQPPNEPSYDSGFITDNNGAVVGRYEAVTDEDGNTTRTEWIDKGNGVREIAHISKDGTEKRGQIEIGAGTSKGVGN